MLDASRVPVIAGIGEAVDRDQALEPKALIIEAALAAGRAAPSLLARVQQIDVVSIISWRYDDLANIIGRQIGADPSIARESEAGGEKPLRLVAEAAARIARGACDVALICGGEATRSRAALAKAGTAPDWGPTDLAAKPLSPLDFVTPLAARNGLKQPTQIYPLYENATRHAWSLSAAEATRESADLWSRYSAVAAGNEFAWLSRFHDTDEISQIGPANRMVAYPYPKLMTANPMVNQSGAILLTSLASAREAGLKEEDLVYVWSGARADEPKDFLQRDRYDHSTAQDAVLSATLRLNALTIGDIDFLELYSCFPVVPKMARRSLGLGPDVEPSIAGGLTFFGGPANNYMTHALASAVRILRGKRDGKALLYGQGEFVTKHAAIVLAGGPPPSAPEMTDVQADADRSRSAIPLLIEDYVGPASIETFTIIYDREGAPIHAPLILRTSSGERCVAQVPASDAELMAYLSNPDNDPCGAPGLVERAQDGLLSFALAVPGGENVAALDGRQ